MQNGQHGALEPGAMLPVLFNRLVRQIMDSYLAIVIAERNLYRLGQNIGIAVRNPLKRVLLLVKLDNENRWVDFFQYPRAFDGFASSTVGAEHDFGTDVRLQASLDIEKRVFSHDPLPPLSL